jgi:hypothetical protein
MHPRNKNQKYESINERVCGIESELANVKTMAEESMEVCNNIDELIKIRTCGINQQLDTIIKQIAENRVHSDRSGIEKTMIMIKTQNYHRMVKMLDEVWCLFLNEPNEIIEDFMPAIKSHISKVHPDYHFDDAKIMDYLKERIDEIVYTPHPDNCE